MLRGERPEPLNLPQEDDNNDDDDRPSPGPRVLSWVELAHTAERGYPKNINLLAAFIGQPKFPELVRRFLFDELNPDSEIPSSAVALNDLPYFSGSVSVFHSAIARFYAPSDLSAELEGCIKNAFGPILVGEANIRGEILSLSYWTRNNLGCMAWLLAEFFSFSLPIMKDEATGMWVVRPEFTGNGRQSLAVIPVDSIERAAHLIGVYGSAFLPPDFPHEDSLDVFGAFYISKYADHHMHEFLVY
ncbi:hypothetical protein JAAARDRAFT_196639 [Jaapia argillacea MUCL 33604]|uniref:Uncharacterized protein n=1 Tax=Jaapia argillacea MUCL 33604 TaxID=933084 RepID=A0A067PH74_9AGAM|nr:hypothetical protein JAAARDRAFT_196639 [Jaapia argillacea MUCL 33604]